MQPADPGPPAPSVDAETAADAVADVLSRPAYGELEPSLGDRILTTLAEGFGRLVAAFTGTPAGSVAGYLVLGLLLVIVAYLVYRLVRSLRPEASQAVAATPGELGRSPEAWISDAEEHEAAGRWREAVRCRYRGLVAALAAAGKVEEVPGRTAGEYLVALRSEEPEAGRPFAAATGVFERAWYGREDVAAHDVEAMAQAAAATLDAAGAQRVEIRR